MRRFGHIRKRPLFAALLTILGLSLVAPLPARAGKKDKYYFALATIELKEGIPAEIEALVRTQVEKSIAEHARIVTTLPEGAPDPKAAPKRFEKFLKRKKLHAYKVYLEVTSYTHEVEPMPPPRRGQRLKVSVELRMFGETIPGRVLAFSGDGSATVILEIGKKLRAADTKAGNHDSIELAVAKALERSITKLAQPPPAKPQGPKKKKRAKK